MGEMAAGLELSKSDNQDGGDSEGAGGQEEGGGDDDDDDEEAEAGGMESLPLGVGSTEHLREYCYLLVPGLLSQYSPPLYFTETLYRLRDSLGLEARIVALDSEAGTVTNAQAILEAVSRAHTETGKRCVRHLGHSIVWLSVCHLSVYPYLLL